MLFQYGKASTAGVAFVPPGYDRWIGLVGNSRYYNYTLSVDGREETHGNDYTEDYLTDLLVRWLKSFMCLISSIQLGERRSAVRGGCWRRLKRRETRLSYRALN